MRETDPRLTWMRTNSGTLLLILSSLFFSNLSLSLSLLLDSFVRRVFSFFGNSIKVLFPREGNWTEIFRNNEAASFVSDTVDRRYSSTIKRDGSSTLIELERRYR